MNLVKRSFKKNIKNYIGKNIRDLRTKKGLSQTDVSSKLGMSTPAFSKIENGITDVNLSRLEQIAMMLETDIANLFEPDAENLKKQVITYNIQTRLRDREEEVLTLQRKIIALYEESRKIVKV